MVAWSVTLKKIDIDSWGEPWFLFSNLLTFELNAFAHCCGMLRKNFRFMGCPYTHSFLLTLAGGIRETGKL